MKTTFNAGDKCVLNSGGPIMTVAGVVGDEVTCSWFNDDGFCDSHTFMSACLTPSRKATLWGES
jgi:uncharacterized protein YodC (DUF2158 family)